MRLAYGAAPWAASRIGDYTPPGQTLPPPIPDGTRRYRLTRQPGPLAHGARGWAGARPLLPYPPGGIVASARPEQGTVELTVWWPDADAVQLLRLAPTGGRTPVRGAYPRRISAPTRRNYCLNPTGRGGLNGYIPAAGNPRLQRVDRSGNPATRKNLCPNPSAEVSLEGYGPRGVVGQLQQSHEQAEVGQWAVRGTADTDGAGGITLPPFRITPAAEYTLSVMAAAPAGRQLRLLADWLDAEGQLVAYTELDSTTGTGFAAWITGSLPAAPDGAITARPYLQVADLATGESLFTDRLLYTPGSAAGGDYFDGSWPDADWDGQPGLSTSTQLLGSVQDRYAIAATIDEAGDCGVTVPTALPDLNLTLTVGLDLRLSAKPAAVDIEISWSDVEGAQVGIVTVTIPADEVLRSVGQWARHVLRTSAPAGGVTPVIKVIARALPAGARMLLAEQTHEATHTDGSAFDGETLGGQWESTPQFSPSVLAPVLHIHDGECPLDRPYAYELINPSLTGGRVVAEQLRLPAQQRSWMTHPQHPQAPVQIVVEDAPEETLAIEQGVFTVLGRRNRVTVSAGRRHSATGSLTFLVRDLAQRDEMLALLDDGQPLLLRTPRDYGYEPSWWVSLGDVTHSPTAGRARVPVRRLSADFVTTDPPGMS